MDDGGCAYVYTCSGWAGVQAGAPARVGNDASHLHESAAAGLPCSSDRAISRQFHSISKPLADHLHPYLYLFSQTMFRSTSIAALLLAAAPAAALEAAEAKQSLQKIAHLKSMDMQDVMW